MRLPEIEFRNHPILKNLKIDFTNPETGHIYGNIIFVGENGCGKTTLLNELFNYDNSEYIVNKEQNYNYCGSCSHKSLFIAQDLKYRNAINNINDKISGSEKIYKDITSIDNTNGHQGANVMSLNKNNIANNSVLLKESIDIFNNDRIKKFLSKNSNKLMDDITKLVGIDGSVNQTMIDTFSSGEQELILRLETIKDRISQNLDMILLDEPETSLHPKWQQKIVPYILDILKDNNSGERDLQLFISSHSENVLKSVFNLDDTLIIRLFKDKDEIKSQSITNMITKLNPTTIAEVQYLVFDITTIEYHNQLYGELLSNYSNQENVDNFLKSLYQNSDNPYGYSWRNNIETLPTYIRNASSHTENSDRNYTEDDLKKSIEILRSVL